MRGELYIYNILAMEDPFGFIRDGFADMLITLLLIIGGISLIVTVIHIMNGDRESANKFLKWLIAIIVGLVLLTIIKNIQ